MASAGSEVDIDEQQDSRADPPGKISSMSSEDTLLVCREEEKDDTEEEEETGEEEPLDPRVMVELNSLNAAADEINNVERELEMSRAKFRRLLSESTAKMEVLYKKNPKNVAKCRPYFLLKREARKAQQDLHRAVMQFQHASSVYDAAKETVMLAEEKFMELSQSSKTFDSAWQEMLNHATMKFNDAEHEKARTEQEHSKKAGKCAEMDAQLKAMERDMPRTIGRAKSFFDTKEKLESQLQHEKIIIEDLQLALQCAKLKYRSALDALEEISDDIHKQRLIAKNLPERTPGVGAEIDDSSSDLPSIDLDPSGNYDALSLDYKDSDMGSMDSFNLTDGTSSIKSSQSEPDICRHAYGRTSLDSLSCNQEERMGNVADKSPETTNCKMTTVKKVDTCDIDVKDRHVSNLEDRNSQTSFQGDGTSLAESVTSIEQIEPANDSLEPRSHNEASSVASVAIENDVGHSTDATDGKQSVDLPQSKSSTEAKSGKVVRHTSQDEIFV